MDNIIDTTREAEIVKMVVDHKFQSENWLKSSGYIDEWRTWNDLYRGIPKAKPYSWMSNKFVPYTNSKVESAVSQLIGLLMAGNPPFQVRPRNPDDDMQAQLMQKLLAYQIEESGTVQEFTQFLRSLCIFGTAIGKVGWDWGVEDKTQLVPVNQMAAVLSKITGKNVGMIPQKIKVKNGCPKFITCNITSIFPDPAAIDIQDSWVVESIFRTKAYLMMMSKYYPEIYNKNVNLISDREETKYTDDSLNVFSNLQREVNPNVSRPSGTNNVELLEWHGKYDFEGNGELKQCCFTVANGKHLIRAQVDPYWHGKNPYVKGVYIPTINEFYGIGIPELMEDMQNNANEIINQRNDNISLSLNSPFKYKKGSGINTSQFILKPGGLYGTDDDIDATISPIQIPHVTQEAFMHVADIERWMQEVTGVTKLTTGVGGAGNNDTATGMSILQRASGERFMAIARGIEQTAWKEILRFFYQYDYQYIDAEQVISILGERGYYFQRVPPEVVKRDYDLVPAGIFSMENKGQKGLRLIQFKQVTRDDPTIKQNELNKKIYMAMEIGDSPEELMRTDGEMMEIMRLAQVMAMKMVMEQQAQEQSKASGKPTPKPKSGGNTSSQYMKGVSNGQGQLPPPTSVNAGNPGAMPS